jgi:phosphatidylinositol alpha-mannosyltransferase
MRIAIVCPYSLDLPGGVQAQVIGMAKAFSREDEVIVYAPGTRIPNALVAKDIKVILLGKTIGIRANGSVAPISLSLRALGEMRKTMRNDRVTATIVHEPLVPLVALGSLFHKQSAMIGTFHRAGVTRTYRALGSFARRTLKTLDAGVVVSEEARATISTFDNVGSQQFKLIPNAVDVTKFSPDAAVIRLPKTLFFLARHEPRKGLATLLDALVLLPDDVRLWIAGSGPETERLQRQFPEGDRVRWLGRISDEQVVGHLRTCEIFVAPSLSGESFGVVLLEAMATGTPVVCSDLAGYHLAAGDDALFVEPGSATALAEAICRLVKDVEMRGKLSAAGLLRARRFTFEGVVESYRALIDALGAA